LIYVADYSGFIYCLDALTGELQWRHDTMAHIWGSTLVADGKVYIGNEDGYLTILPAGRTLDSKKVVEVDMTSPVYSSPVAANGVLYVATHTHLFAIEAGASVAGKSEKEGR
jgi:outer membrane protein assembly factor BamB